MINYVLEPNGLIGETNKYRAQVINSRSYNFDDIVDNLISRNIGLSPSAIRGVWEGIKAAVEEIVSQGGSINTELFHIKTTIKGVFDGIDDGFDPSRHEIKLRMRSGALLRDTPKRLKVKKHNATIKNYIYTVTDVKTGMVDTNLTPGKNIKITGNRLKVIGPDPSCGLYFIPEKTTEATIKLDTSELVVNNPSEIIAVIPALKKGRWHLKLVTQYCQGAKHLKEPQSVTYGKVFTVA